MRGMKTFAFLALAALVLASLWGCGSNRDSDDGITGPADQFGTDPETGIRFVGAGTCIGCHEDLSFSEELVQGYLASKHVNHSTAINAASPESCLECHDPIGDGSTIEDLIDPANVPAEGLAAVGCENCHGPGGEHFGIGPVPNFSPNFEVCGECHMALPDLPEFHPEGLNIIENYLQSAHADDARTSAPCFRCHSDEGFRMFVDGTRELDADNLEEVLATEPPVGDAPIQCRTCHDPHETGTLRVAESDVSRDSEGTTFGRDEEGNRIRKKNFSSQVNLCTACHQAFLDYIIDEDTGLFTYDLVFDPAQPSEIDDRPFHGSDGGPTDGGGRVIWDTHFRFLDPVGDEILVTAQVAASSDDAEELSTTGEVQLTSGDLEMSQGETGTGITVGMRFPNVAIPNGATILDAFIQFQASTLDTAASDTVASNLSIFGEAADDAAAFAATDGDISARPPTGASVSWTPPAWTAGEADVDQQTADIAPVIQEIVDRAGWAETNALAIIVTGTGGRRSAFSFDNEAGGVAPVLHVAYTTETDVFIPGYNINAADDNACLNCHEVHGATKFAQADAVEIANQWAESGHADYLGEPFNHEFDDGECMKCHSGTEYARFVQGVPQDELDLAGGPRVVACVACHDLMAQNNADEFELGPTRVVDEVVFPSGAVQDLVDASNLCAECHQGRESGLTVVDAIAENPGGPHSFVNRHYFAAAAIRFGTDVTAGFEYEGQSYLGENTYPDHPDSLTTCIGCHLRKASEVTPNHTFEPSIETCALCHEGIVDFEDIGLPFGAADVDYDGDDVGESFQDEIDGMEELLLAAIQAYAADTLLSPVVYDPGSYPYWFNDLNGNGVAENLKDENGDSLPGDEINFGNRFTSFDDALLKAAYNFHSNQDPCGDMHNYKYVLQTAYDSIDDLDGGGLDNSVMGPEVPATRP